MVKVAAIQTRLDSEVQGFLDRLIFFQKIEGMIDTAVKNGANIIAFPELFSMPYPFYTPYLVNWKEYAETEKGQTFQLMERMSLKYNLVIIYSILELSDSKEYFNTCIVVSNRGELIGKYRKYHIPPIEQPYLTPGEFDNTVIETDFGKIGILICYERHFPLKWQLLALNGAEIIFNPSSEDENTLSHKMWFNEGLNAAVVNGVYTVSINRCGTESFDEKSFKYFGSSYVASPLGSIFPTQQQQNSNEYIIVADIDLSTVSGVKEEFSFHKNKKLALYAEKLYEIQQKSESK